MTLLNYLGVYTNDIENSVNRMEDELERIGWSFQKIDDVYDVARDYMSAGFSWEDPTNYIIYCIYSTFAAFLEDEEFKVEYNVNGFCSSFDILA